MAGYVLLDDAPQGGGYTLIDSPNNVTTDGSFIGNVIGGAKVGAKDFGNRLAQILTAGAQNGMGSVEAHLSGMEMPSEDYPQYKKALNQDIKDNRADPVLKTGGGKVGHFIAKAAPATAATFIPGGQTLAGSILIGGLFGGLEPLADNESSLPNMAFGAAGGAAGYGIGKGIGYLGEKRTIASDLAKSLSQPKSDVLDAARQVGYVTNPTAINPSWNNKLLESIGGKAAVGQEAAARNQQITNSVARNAIGLPENVPLSPQAIAGLKSTVSQPYADVGGLSEKSAGLLQAWKQANADARGQFAFYNRSLDPAVLVKAQEARGIADSLHQAMQEEAASAGRPELIGLLDKARVELAKIGSVDRSLNAANGDVSAQTFGALFKKGVPLSDGLETIGAFQQAFPNLARDGAKVPTSGVSNAKILSSMLMGGGGFAAGGPLGTVAAIAPFADGPIRSMLLSNAYQNMLKVPGTGGSSTLNALSSDYAKALLQGAGTAGAIGYGQ